jgi:hypothetical protein
VPPGPERMLRSFSFSIGDAGCSLALFLKKKGSKNHTSREFSICLKKNVNFCPIPDSAFVIRF